MKTLRVVALAGAVLLSSLAGAQPQADLVRQAQEVLMSEGFDPGAVDGALGPETRRGLKNFQESRRLEQTGELDPPTIAALGLSAERDEPRYNGAARGRRRSAS